MAQNQGRPLQTLDYIRHGKRLAGSGHAEQRNGINPVLEGGAQTVDCCRLVAGWTVGRLNLEFH